MKKTILFALIAIMFLALFTGCRAYRRTTPYTAPGYEVTNNGGTTTRGFHYREDGYPSGGRVTRGHQRDGGMTRGHHPGHDGLHNYRHDGRVTDTDGIIGNGTFADRPATDGTNNTVRRGVDDMGGTLRGTTAITPGTKTVR